LLEEQEGAIEVHAEYRNWIVHPKKARLMKLDKGDFKKFLRRKLDKNKEQYDFKEWKE